VWVGRWFHDSNVAEEALRGFGSSLDFGFPFLGSCWVVSSQKLYGERSTTAFASFLWEQHLNLWFGQLYISFWAHYFMLKDWIGTFVFIEAAMIMRVVGKMKLAILIVSIAI